METDVAILISYFKKRFQSKENHQKQRGTLHYNKRINLLRKRKMVLKSVHTPNNRD